MISGGQHKLLLTLIYSRGTSAVIQSWRKNYTALTNEQKMLSQKPSSSLPAGQTVLSAPCQEKIQSSHWSFSPQVVSLIKFLYAKNYFYVQRKIILHARRYPYFMHNAHGFLFVLFSSFLYQFYKNGLANVFVFAHIFDHVDTVLA